MKPKRCKAASPGLGWRCELPRGHVINPLVNKHQAMFARWSDNEGSTWTGKQKPSETNPVEQLSADGGLSAKGVSWPMVDFEGRPIRQMGKEDMVSTPLGGPVEITFQTDGKDASISHMVRDLMFGEDAILPQPPQMSDAEIELRSWWGAQSAAEINATVPKAIEYGANDLLEIGLQVSQWAGRKVTEQEAAELGCWFYIVGKLARANSAIERGTLPSDDTVHDIGIYIKMVQRIRAAGNWPGVDLTEPTLP